MYKREIVKIKKLGLWEHSIFFKSKVYGCMLAIVFVIVYDFILQI